jgi:uncharacterized protein
MQLRWIAATFGVMLVGYTAVRWVNLDELVAALTAVAILAVGRQSGLDWKDIGLARTTWKRGLLWALCGFALVAAIYAVILLTPLDVLLDDSRYDDGWAKAWVTALIVVPLGTVLWEELAFRGVLWGQLRSRWSTQTATIVSSLLFGIWHALPALRFADSNESVTTVSDGAGTTVGTVIVTVLLTGLGGAVLCELRRRSDSLLAPIGLHWAINGLGVLAVAAASS